MATVAPPTVQVSIQPVSPHGPSTRLTVRAASSGGTPVRDGRAGLAGFYCEVTGSPVAFADCLACAKARQNPGCPLPAAIIERIVTGIRPPHLADQIAAEHGAPIGFSVTELLKCSRRKRLEKEHAWYEKPQGLYRMMRGTAVHDYLNIAASGMRESRLSWTFKYAGWTITLSGQPDVVEMRSEGLYVADYKVTENPPRDQSTWVCSGCGAACMRSKGGFLCPNCGQIGRSAAYRTVEAAQARSTHSMQINLYCLLIEKNLHSVVQSLGATGEPLVCGGEVIYLPPTLPMRCPISYNRDATLAFLKDRLRVLLAPDLPPVLAEDDEGKWECGFCPLAEVCASE